MPRVVRGPFHNIYWLDQAFYTVCGDGLWQIMEKFGCQRKFMALVRQLHDGMMASVLDNGDMSDSFQSRAEWNRAVFSLLPSSARYSQHCFMMLHNIMTLASNSGTEQMEECSTSDDSQQKQRSRSHTERTPLCGWLRSQQQHRSGNATVRESLL